MVRFHDPPEAFSRVKIDALLKDVGWDLTDGRSVSFEYPLPDGTRADYALCDRHGPAMAVIEAKRSSTDPRTAERQATDYALQFQVPFAFLSNGSEIWFWEYEREAHPHAIRTFFSQEDLEGRIATVATGTVIRQFTRNHVARHSLRITIGRGSRTAPRRRTRP